jgi:enoyl-CoA hydratase/carnithine racemase
MSARLWRAVGMARARELSYTARVFSGREAAAWGMAVAAVPASELDATVDALVAQIASNSTGSLAAYKQLYRDSADAELSAGLAMEAATTFQIEDTEERISAFR